MDLVLDMLDQNFFTPYVYPATWPENDCYRQFISLFVITSIGGVIMYFSFATFSFFLCVRSRAYETPADSRTPDL